MKSLTWNKRRDRAQLLIQKLQECEIECHVLEFTGASHAVNAAKNAVGWDLADAADTRRRAHAIRNGGKRP